ncbi:MAG: cytochrome c oxidase accessory protein CcoG [Gammaproteobacteria bacterium]|nr:cytochrome c oxidase accessory protein CcoG [Gammaproteobacteria bacterium]NNM01826.1 cytochrome c oxidase accessory protein CcoG [Gammaproteobacteria bacterium]
MLTETEAEPTRDKHGEDVEQTLYAKREKIYPREVHGLYAGLRVTAVVLLLGLFYGTCWLQWDGHQAILWDLPARKFYVGPWIFWPQEFYYLTALLVTAALALFLFTALAGRLWCGYACPQTVWTEIFMWMERAIEGDRPRQMKLDKAPWSLHKLRIKATKHAVWIAFALFTGFTFVGYFTPIRELTAELMAGTIGGWALFWIVFYGFATYGNAGWMREQVCLYMCPYARFQSAMFDQDTLIIAYDETRGEPRGGRKRGDDPKALGLGDCVNCTMCVQVCPTGIDIREGLQYECIGCSACIDVCNDVMGKVGYDPGLIRYTTQNAIDGKPTRILRPRLFIYATLLAIVVSLLGWSLAERVPLQLDVMRDRNSLYRENAEGRIENVYTLSLMNLDRIAHEYAVSVSGLPGLRLEMDTDRLALESGEILTFPVRVNADEYDLKAQSNDIEFEVHVLDAAGYEAREDARFIGPRQ